MIRSRKDITICPKCKEELKQYYVKGDTNEVYKRCPLCVEVYCISVLNANNYETRLGGFNV